MNINSAKQKYYDALEKRASAGFIGCHEAQQWIFEIRNNRMSAQREVQIWGMDLKDILEISLRVFDRHYLYFEETLD